MNVKSICYYSQFLVLTFLIVRFEFVPKSPGIPNPAPQKKSLLHYSHLPVAAGFVIFLIRKWRWRRHTTRKQIMKQSSAFSWGTCGEALPWALSPQPFQWKWMLPFWMGDLHQNPPNTAPDTCRAAPWTFREAWVLLCPRQWGSSGETWKVLPIVLTQKVLHASSLPF